METKDLPQWLSAVAAAFSACGVFLVLWQIMIIRRQAVTKFEDGLAREYRELAAKLPWKALLGKDLAPEEYEKSVQELIHYIDLSNEQVFLRQLKRISRDTWVFWRDGIKSNLERPAFSQAWCQVKKSSENFSELRRLEKERFSSDPADWT